MLIYENIRLALSSLKANKMRALLTMLGIIIGISSVIAIMTVGNSVTHQLTDSMSSLGVNNINVGIQMKEDKEERREDGLNFGKGGKNSTVKDTDFVTKEMIEAYVENYPEEVAAISAESQVGSGQVIDGNLYANVSVLGVSTGYFVANDTTMLAGRFFTTSEMEEGKNVAFVSDKLVNNMFKGDMDVAIGSEIQVFVDDKAFKYVIVGVYEYEQSPYSFSFSSEKDTTTSLYIPLHTAQEIKHAYNYTSFMVVTTADVDPDSFASSTKQFFNTYYRNNRNWEVSAFSMASLVDTMGQLMGTLTTAISVIAGIALLVGGIGVMNIMLVSITERTREIGTRKALGAPNSSIRTQFIVEAIVICLIGGIIGVGIGVFAGTMLANYLEAPATPSAQSIILSLTFSMAIGIFFGYYPANKAAKMDPIEALRYE